MYEVALQQPPNRVKAKIPLISHKHSCGSSVLLMPIKGFCSNPPKCHHFSRVSAGCPRVARGFPRFPAVSRGLPAGCPRVARGFPRFHAVSRPPFFPLPRLYSSIIFVMPPTFVLALTTHDPGEWLYSLQRRTGGPKTEKIRKCFLSLSS